MPQGINNNDDDGGRAILAEVASNQFNQQSTT
jgi:hypothetical protein